MFERIILSYIAVLFFALAIKHGEKRTILSTGGLTLGIMLTWSKMEEVITTGLILYMMTALAISAVNLQTKGLTKLQRATIAVSGLFAFAANFFVLMAWPYAAELRWSMIIPLFLYFDSLLHDMTKRKEIGYLTILNVEFLLRLLIR